MDIPSGGNHTGVFALATVNLGVGGLITVTTDTGGAVLPLSVSMGQTNAAGGCLASPELSVTTFIGTGGTPTFAFFVLGTGTVSFDPAGHRLFVRLKDAGGETRGGSSVAPRSVP